MKILDLGGPIFRLKGSILAMSFLDCNGGLIPYSFESWRDENKRDSKYYPIFIKYFIGSRD